jgi:hypothetical protein
LCHVCACADSARHADSAARAGCASGLCSPRCPRHDPRTARSGLLRVRLLAPAGFRLPAGPAVHWCQLEHRISAPVSEGIPTRLSQNALSKCPCRLVGILSAAVARATARCGSATARTTELWLSAAVVRSSHLEPSGTRWSTLCKVTKVNVTAKALLQNKIQKLKTVT